MRSKTTSKRVYLDYSNEHLAEILLYSPYVIIFDKDLTSPKTPRLPQGLKEEREAHIHSQIQKELVKRLGSSSIAEKVILAARYTHLHYCYGKYLLQVNGSDQAQIGEVTQCQGIPMLLARKYVADLIEKEKRNWLESTISVLSEDGEKEIYVARIIDLAKAIKQI